MSEYKIDLTQRYCWATADPGQSATPETDAEAPSPVCIALGEEYDSLSDVLFYASLTQGEELDEQYARRLTACANVCEGIPTESLEQGVIAELIAVVTKLTNQLERIGDHRKDAPFIEAGKDVLAKLKGCV